MVQFSFDPPIANSACPWATDLNDLKKLYECSFTGAVTTRTSLLNGFPHDDTIHQYTFFDPSDSIPTADKDKPEARETASLNTLGYSPYILRDYLGFIKEISDGLPDETVAGARPKYKPFIISVTGTVDDVVECYRQICQHQAVVKMPLAMEVNLSCPNIPNKPPPAYSGERLTEYLTALKSEVAAQREEQPQSPMSPTLPTAFFIPRPPTVPIGIKTPPYTYADQFCTLTNALLNAARAAPTHLPCPVSFITATNTLGTSLLLSPYSDPGSAIPPVFHHTLNSATGTGLGGMAGAPLHPLALGNVYTLRGQLFQHSELSHIQIIGVGGVDDVAGFRRMRAVGASAVGIGTALGRKGLAVFEEIANGLEVNS